MKANEKYLVNTQEQPERGKIYDRNGKVLAEDNLSSISLADISTTVANFFAVFFLSVTCLGLSLPSPKHVTDKKKTAKKLATVVDMSAKEIEDKLNNKKAFQVEFGQKYYLIYLQFL
jgi:penicillin-binding protein 1